MEESFTAQMKNSETTGCLFVRRESSSQTDIFSGTPGRSFYGQLFSQKNPMTTLPALLLLRSQWRCITCSLVLFQIFCTMLYNVTCFTDIIIPVPSSHYVVIIIIFAFVTPLLFIKIRCHLSLFAIMSLLLHESEKEKRIVLSITMLNAINPFYFVCYRGV